MFFTNASSGKESENPPKVFTIGQQKIIFNSRGLVPAIVKTETVGQPEVTHLVYLNPEALKLSLASGVLFFYRRSKRKIERLGEKEGNTFKIKTIQLAQNHRSLLITLLDDHGVYPRKSFLETIYSIEK